MAEGHSLLEEDFCCPICCDIFKVPVVLKCSHSLCEECLREYWDTQLVLQCPVCRKECSADEPTRSLAFTSLCENFKNRKGAASAVDVCPEHDEKLKLFCFEDKQPICVVCYTSKKHENHKCSPVVEAAKVLKEDLKDKILTLNITLDGITEAQASYEEKTEQITAEIEITENKIKAEFEKFHQFLKKEEEARITALRKMGKMKISPFQTRIDEMTKEISVISENVAYLLQLMESDHIAFLKTYSENLQRLDRPMLHMPKLDSETKIDDVDYIPTLLFSVWARMQNLVPNAPVTLDPNTASNRLVVSEDLCSVYYVEQRQMVPDNPERLYVGVLGSQGFRSGLHCWDVEVGENDHWTVGVVKESIERKKLLNMDPSSGMWSIRLSRGVYRVGVKIRKELYLPEKPWVIRIQLDCDSRKLKFFDPFRNTTLYTFTNIVITEPLYPYLCTGCSTQALNLYPANSG
ncbi:zinc-binding protein A33-like isoform X2 [Brachyhypopomus gauderio]|uniref:zinc-binding protein A33-like isoform X2 n=1 Tax=Brachyhypopomus gauderio TaxID=698409 RepID=UPI0040411D77